MAACEGGLADRSLAAVKWNYLGALARIASQVVVQIALARLLGPDALGLFAFAFLAVGVGGILVEMGLGAALVQRAEVSEADVRIVFTRVLLAGVTIGLLGYLVAPLFTTFFGDPRISGVIRGLMPVFVFQALTVTPVSLLKRDLAFKAIQGVQIASYLAGFLVVGIGLAMLGAGVWSLVSAWIAQTAIAAILFYMLKRHSLKPKFTGGDAAMGGFGTRVLLTNMVNWVIENVDNLLVGKLFGSTALGLYSVSYNLVRNPANHLVVTLQAVLFPASARAQDNRTGLHRAYLTVVGGVAILALPVFLGVAAVADTVVAALFGSQWEQASLLLIPLAIAMAFHAPMAVAGPVLWGKGAAGTELRVQVWTGIVLVASLLVASRYSVTAMAWAVCGVYALRLVGMTVVLLRHIQLPFVAFLTSVRGGALAALFTTSVLLGLDTHFAATAPMIRLTFEVIAAGLALGLFVFGLPGLALSDDLAVLAQRLLAPMPGTAGWLERVRASHPGAWTSGAL